MKLYPYPPTAPSTLSDRVTQLEARTIPNEVVWSDSVPDNTQWDTWYQAIYDYTAWTLDVIHWGRVNDMAHPFNAPGNARSLPLPEHSDATETAPGVFETRLPGNATLTYNTARGRGTNILDRFTFPAGMFSKLAWRLLDAQKVELAGYGTAAGGDSVGPTLTGFSQFFNPFPANAAFVRYILTKASDNTTVVYDCPIV